MNPQWFSPEFLKKHKTLSQAQFQVAPLTRMQMWELGDHHAFDGTAIRLKVSGRQHLLRSGLRDWRGITHDGKDVPCPVGNVEAMLEHLDALTLDAVAAEIWRISRLTEDQRKNC